MSKASFYLSAAMIALVATPAAAQDLRGSAADKPKDGAQEASPNTADIVVTATRRSERLSNVPIAVSAFGQAAL